MGYFLILVLLLVGCAAQGPLVSRATAGPFVVFESGLGDGADIWDRVVLPPGVSRFAWTRAGYDGLAGGLVGGLVGGSVWESDSDGRRTGAEVAAHLDAALATAGARPPYVLVAHSIGASYALSYASAHPGQIAGIVLVDPRLPGFSDLCRAEGLRGCDIPPLLRLALGATERLELDGGSETEAALADLSALHDIPITILVATRPGLAEDARWRGLWIGYAEQFAAKFRRPASFRSTAAITYSRQRLHGSPLKS